MVSVIELDSLPRHSHLAIRPVLSDQLDVGELLRGQALYSALAFLEVDVAWLVVIDDRHYSLSVLALQLLLSVRIEQDNLELAVWVPVVIVNDLDFDGLSLAWRNGDDIVDWLIVFAFLGIALDGLDLNLVLFFSLVLDNNINVAGGL